MKSFLRFATLSGIYLLLFSVFPVLIDGSFESFHNTFAITFCLSYFSVLAFSHVYVFEKVKRKQSLLKSIMISILILLVVLLLQTTLLQYCFFQNIQYQAILLQLILGICLFILQFLVLNFLQNLKSRSQLSFSDRPFYYVKVILILTGIEFVFLAMMSYDIIIYDFSFKRLLESQYMLAIPLLINSVCFLSLKYLNRFDFIQSKNLLLIFLTALIGFCSVYLLNWFYFKYQLVALLMDGLFSIFAALFIYTFVSYRDKMNNSLKKITMLSKSFSKKEAEYLQLKNQVNPHFLFNNLNTLISFIESDPKKAVEFGHNLSNVYRYYMKSQTEDFVSLKSELAFIKEYLEIYKAKFEAGFSFEIEAAGEGDYILASALQELVDNIFRHNILDEQNPLSIKIAMDEEHLIVKNTVFNKRNDSVSGTGLDNIAKRYQILVQKTIVVEKDSYYFCVKLPVLKLVP